jgi:hypothetical protein
VQRVEQRWRLVDNSMAVVATGTLSEHVPGTVGLSSRYCSTGSGLIRCTLLFFNYSIFAQISKYKTKTILMPKIIETLLGARVDHSTQLLPLGRLRIFNRIQVIKLGTNSTLIVPRIFKGFKPFWKNLINSMFTGYT